MFAMVPMAASEIYVQSIRDLAIVVFAIFVSG